MDSKSRKLLEEIKKDIENVEDEQRTVLEENILKRINKFMFQNRLIKIGDSVMWRGGWGTDNPLEAKVTGIELTSVSDSFKARCKYGKQVEEIEVKKKNACIFTLDNSHWAYGMQIDII